MMVVAVSTSETSVNVYETARNNIPEVCHAVTEDVVLVQMQHPCILTGKF
jgi:hypothetical protein